jgi:hypothetical protein
MEQASFSYFLDTNNHTKWYGSDAASVIVADVL